MKIKSLQEYIDYLAKLNAICTYIDPKAFEIVLDDVVNYCSYTYIPHFIYRGQPDYKYNLIPGIYRYKNTLDKFCIPPYSISGFDMLKDFILDACHFANNISEDNFSAWLEMAQHFGVPTRLLDFTENPLVALYFACSDLLNCDGAVWIVNELAYRKEYPLPVDFNNLSSQEIINKIIKQEINVNNDNCIVNPYIYKPFYREERMIAQASVFMIWGFRTNNFNDIIKMEEYIDIKSKNKQYNKILCCVKISKEKKESILKQLDECGINEKFIYPGLDGIGKYIRTKYSVKVNDEITEENANKILKKYISKLGAKQQ